MKLWAMSDVQDLPEPQAVSTTELVNLLVNATESCSSQPTQFNHNSPENNGLGLGALFGAESEEDSGHSADGNEFHPTAERGVFMFGNEVIAPNHHMAIHLAECLDKFGPVRSWWAFPLEQHMGELEVSFLNSFCRLGNLRVLLESDRLPDDLKRFIT
ncbi:hypothetical protein MJO29_009299 [Puccinia striiformis f. sp. tritici]|nr:hypothetical protein MJO29_009299 [Puccinia striiformis f. sp. tritici]